MARGSLCQIVLARTWWTTTEHLACGLVLAFLVGGGACAKREGASSQAPMSRSTRPPDPAGRAVAQATGPAYSSPAQAAAAAVSSSPANTQSVGISDGMPVYFVRLDRLAAYRPGQDTKALLLDKQEIAYPITVAGDVQSFVTVQKRADGNWIAAQFVDANTARAYHSSRQGVLARRRVDGGRVSLVEIPTVGALLSSHTEGGVLMLTPVYDVPGTSFTAGVTRPATEVFQALQSLAAKVDPGVPG